MRVYWIFWLGISFGFCMCSSEKATNIESNSSGLHSLESSTSVHSEKQDFTPKTFHNKTTQDTLHARLPTATSPDLKGNIQTLRQALQNQQAIKIICYGNSITRGYKVGTYGTVARPYPQVLQDLLQKEFANPNIQVINEGHNGWRTDQALRNVHQLVIEKKPQWVILEFGINDAYAGFSPTQIENYLTQTVQLLQQNQISVILLSPTPILTPQHKTVLSYIETIYRVAQKTNSSFCNLHQKLVNRLYEQQISPKRWLPDEVHFADEYYAWIAEVVHDFVKKN